jgi:hypothetical protein
MAPIRFRDIALEIFEPCPSKVENTMPEKKLRGGEDDSSGHSARNSGGQTANPRDPPTENQGEKEKGGSYPVRGGAICLPKESFNELSRFSV